MRLIFDLGHPAHFHLFKNVIGELKARGNEIEIIARQKDCLLELLESSGLPYQAILRRRDNLTAKGWQNVKAFKLALSLARQKRTDFIVGTSVVAAPVARLTKAVSVIFSEDDADVIPIFAKLAYPFAHYVITPNSLRREEHGKKHIRYAGYHELAYLHSNHFAPNRGILRELDVKEEDVYFLIRLVSLTAHHDIGEEGVSTEQAKFLVNHLLEYGKVFISAEKTVDEELRKYILPTKAEQIFDVMAFASMVIGDSQSMVLESAVLGTPSIRCNTFVGRLSCMEELEHRYGLTFGFLPRDFDEMISTVDKLLLNPNLKKEWAEKREKMLSECVDLTSWMIDLFYNLYEERCKKDG